MKTYLSEHLRNRSDLEFFRFENDEQYCDTEIAKREKLIQETAESQQNHVVLRAEIERLKQDKAALKKP